ncbi:hypothetical protein ABT167_18515 [Streptomyces sp. NPDC001792]|uniref:hypothetical protein n=1 Tax=Streptomyces sp. NPDC001792 TaxID=3154524 RepID=UPI0033191C23
MRTTTLGTHGPEVGVVGLGAMGMSFAYDMATPRDEATSVSVIHQALDLAPTTSAGVCPASSRTTCGPTSTSRPRSARSATASAPLRPRSPWAWLVAQGEHVVPIPGTKTPKYLVDNAGGADVRLSEADLADFDAIPAPVGARY